MAELNAIAVLVTLATPETGVDGWAALQIMAVIAWLLGLRVTAASTEDLDAALRIALIDSLGRARLTDKEAADLMRWDVHNFRHALRGDPRHHLSLTRLVRLPWTFWLIFLPDLTYVVAKQRVREIGESCGLRKSA